VVDVAAAVEVEQRRGGGGVGRVARRDGVEGAVEARHVGLVVLLVVQLHDLPGDVGLEGGVVVCMTKEVREKERWRGETGEKTEDKEHEHGRSGSVALPRTKLVLAMAAAGFMALARRAPRRAGTVRRRVVDIVAGVVFRFALVCCCC
jgi:hypothetical protein